MIIDDDYCQYDTFRIINRADADAIAAFGRAKETFTEKQARAEELVRWKKRVEEMRAVTQETEESVYQLTYAERMVQCWEKEKNEQ